MIPTTKELIFNILSSVKCDNEIEYLQNNVDGQELLNELENKVRVFVEFHVEATKEEIFSKIQPVDLKEYGSYDHIEKENIFNAHPSTNIK